MQPVLRCARRPEARRPGRRERPPLLTLRAPRPVAGAATSGGMIVEIAETGATAATASMIAAAARRRRGAGRRRAACRRVHLPTR